MNKKNRLHLLSFASIFLSFFLIGAVMMVPGSRLESINLIYTKTVIASIDYEGGFSTQELHKTAPPTPWYSSQGILAKTILGWLKDEKAAAGTIVGAVVESAKGMVNLTKVDRTVPNLAYNLDPYNIDKIALKVENILAVPGSIPAGGGIGGSDKYNIGIGVLAPGGSASVGSTITPTGGVSGAAFDGSFISNLSAIPGIIDTSGFIIEGGTGSNSMEPSVSGIIFDPVVNGNNVTFDYRDYLVGENELITTSSDSISVSHDESIYNADIVSPPEDFTSWSWPDYKYNNDYIWIPPIITPGVTPPPTVTQDPISVFLQNQCKKTNP